MRRWATPLVSLATVVVACYFAVGQPPQPDDRRPDGPPGQRDRSGRRDRGPAVAVPAKTGVVTSLSKNPDGEVDGLKLDDGTEVRFRPEAGEKVAAAVKLNEQVTIDGWTHSGETGIHAATIRIESSGKTVSVDRPPPELAQRGGDDRPSRSSSAGTGRPANPAPEGTKPTPSRRAEPGPYPGFVKIPAGSFDMGDHHGFVDPKHGSDELPIHTVRLDAFAMGIYDVTTEEYCDYLNAALKAKEVEVRQGGVYLAGGEVLLCDTRQSAPSSPVGWDGKRFSVLDRRERHPMVCVRWHGAVVYCNWISRQKGLPECYDTRTWDCNFNKSGFRLPTEAEWEYAARGGLQEPYYNYPWGSDADPNKANVPESRNPFRDRARPTRPPAGYKSGSGPAGQAWRTGAEPLTTPVGFFNGKLQRKADFHWPAAAETYQTADGANGYGLYDMAGNVWQWCTEWYERNYYAYAPAENPPGPAEGGPMPDGKPYRCMRGGSWFNGEFGHSRVSNRDPSYFRGPDPVTGLSDADGPWFHIGFRLLLPIDAESRPAIKPTPVVRVRGQDGGPPGGGRRPREGGQHEGGRRPREAGGEGDDNRPPRRDAAPGGQRRPASASAASEGSLAIRSPAIGDDGVLPKEYTGDGDGVSPPLEWSGAPAGTKSYALVMHHTDPRGENVTYWIVYNIPGDVRSLPRDVQNVGKLGIGSRIRRPVYTPPHSAGPGRKNYVFTLYALSSPLDLDRPASEVTYEVLQEALKGRVLASADLDVNYTRYAEGESDAGDRREQRRPGEGRPERSRDNGGERRPRRPDAPTRPANP